MTSVPCPGHLDHTESKHLVTLKGAREIRRCATNIEKS